MKTHKLNKQQIETIKYAIQAGIASTNRMKGTKDIQLQQIYNQRWTSLVNLEQIFNNNDNLELPL